MVQTNGTQHNCQNKWALDKNSATTELLLYCTDFCSFICRSVSLCRISFSWCSTFFSSENKPCFSFFSSASLCSSCSSWLTQIPHKSSNMSNTMSKSNYLSWKSYTVEVEYVYSACKEHLRINCLLVDIV